MARRFLLVAALLCCFILQGRTQSDLQDPLGSAFRASACAKLRALLPAKSCVVLFSGGFIAQDDAQRYAQPFGCDPDFYYLTGLRIPNAVAVIFSEPKTLIEGSVSTLVFLPDKTDYGLVSMGYEYRGKFGSQEGNLSIRQASQWRKFCMEILANESVEKIYTKPMRLSTFQEPGSTSYQENCAIFYAALAPGFPFGQQAQARFKKIATVDFKSVPALVQEIRAWIAYQPQESCIPLLDRFLQVQTSEELMTLQAEMRRIKINIQEYSSTYWSPRMLKTEAELVLIRKSVDILEDAFKAAASRAAAGKAEARMQAAAMYVALRDGARLAMPPVVASGKNSARPNYVANAGVLPSSGPVILDLALEVNGYHARATRTLPIGGSFGADVKALYEGTLALHQKQIKACTSGATIASIGGIASGGFTELDKTLIFTSNGLGARHIVKVQFLTGIGLELEELALGNTLQIGQVLSVETAIYLGDGDGVTTKWRSTGIALRDMLYIGANGTEVLTKGIPSDLGSLIALVQTPIRLPED
jgi:Xaa-Pro aminopeptidase